jgi:hypothetical protein
MPVTLASAVVLQSPSIPVNRHLMWRTHIAKLPATHAATSTKCNRYKIGSKMAAPVQQQQAASVGLCMSPLALWHRNLHNKNSAYKKESSLPHAGIGSH